MNISDIAKFEWEKGDEEFEKWYNAELEFIVFSKGAIPLVPSKHSFNTLALNKRFFYEENGNRLWDEDRRNFIKMGSKFFKKLVSETEKSIQEVKSITKHVEHVRIVNEYVLSEVQRAFLILWHIFLSDLGKVLPLAIKERLACNRLSEKQIEEVMDYCFNFKHPLGFQKEEDDLRKIFLLIKKKYKGKKVRFEELSDDIKSLLTTHWKQYQYLTIPNIDTEPFTVRDFFKKLDTLPIKSPVRISKLPQEIKKLLDKDTIDFLKLVHRHIFFDNYAADLDAKLDFLMNEYLSKHFSISFSDLSYYSFEELEHLVAKGLKLKKHELEERKKYRVMLQISGEIEFFYGKKIFQKIKIIADKNIKLGKVSTISGIVASLGIVKGLVKIVMGRKDIGKVNFGDILVAPTTQPDLMLAIRRCVAIVTDSGGITSHTAIISRELKIPCIVGTQIATQVLKDGDLVEVDADKGIVRIIERA